MLRRSCLWAKAFANIGSFDLSSGRILCLNCRITASKRSRLSGGVPGPKRFFCSKSAPLTDKDPAASPVKVEKQADVSSSGASSPTPGGAVAGGGIGSTLSYANETYHDFERKLMARIKESNQRRFRVVLALVVGLVSWVVFVFGARLRKLLTDHTAGLAKETLENESLKIQTKELAMAVVQTILNDQVCSKEASRIVSITPSERPGHRRARRRLPPRGGQQRRDQGGLGGPRAAHPAASRHALAAGSALAAAAQRPLRR